MDLRFAFRGLTRNPGFAALVIATMALGIGANTAMFSVVRAVLLRPLPFPDQDRLVALLESDPARNVPERRVTPANFVDWSAQSTVFEATGALPNWTGVPWPFNIVFANGVARVPGIYASAGFFRVLGIAPALGHTFSREEDTRAGTRRAVISDQLWRDHFGSDPLVVGKTIVVDTWRGGPFTVIGVMPRTFEFPPGVKIWLSLGDWGAGPMPPADAADRCCSWYAMMARLKPGVTPAQAAAELTTIAGRINQRHPNAARVAAVKVTPLRDQMVGSQRLVILGLFGAAGCVLLIACANVANLLLSRTIGRQKEIVTRMALGATRWHIIRQLFVESLVLAALGALAGLVLARWTADALVRALATRVPFIENTRFDGAVLAFTMLLTVACALACGLAPLAQWRARSWNARGQSESRASRRLRSALVIAEVAISVTLVASAGLLIKTVFRLQDVDLGVRTAHVLVMETDFNVEGLRERGTGARLLEQLMPRLAALPGVQSAAAGTALPAEARTPAQPITREGFPRRPTAESPQIVQTAVTPGYFAALGIALKSGRLIAESDTAGGKLAAVISETAARRYWPGEDPIGKRFVLGSLERFGSRRVPGQPEIIDWREIVGVVADVRSPGYRSELLPEVYHSYRQFPIYDPRIIVRTINDPLALAGAVRLELERLNPRAVITKIQTMDEMTAEVIAEPRLRAVVIGMLSALALFLGMLGIYGVTAYTVAQRTQEIGIRLALGAQRSDVARLIVMQAFRLTAAGIVLGLAGAFAAGRAIASLLFNVEALDTWILSGAVLALAITAGAASYLPARRSTRVDPAIALRAE